MIDPRERQLVTHVVESLRSHRLSEGATKEIQYVLDSVGQREVNHPGLGNGYGGALGNFQAGLGMGWHRQLSESEKALLAGAQDGDLVRMRGLGPEAWNADRYTEEKKRERIEEYEKFCTEAEKFFEVEGYYPTLQLMSVRAERIDPFLVSEFPDIAWCAKMLMEIYRRTWAPWPIRLWKRLFGGEIYKWAVRAGNDLHRD